MKFVFVCNKIGSVIHYPLSTLIVRKADSVNQTVPSHWLENGYMAQQGMSPQFNITADILPICSFYLLSFSSFQVNVAHFIKLGLAQNVETQLLLDHIDNCSVSLTQLEYNRLANLYKILTISSCHLN